MNALLDAVIRRSPETVRALMQQGADARSGVYPHRDATSALTIATERGYDEIVAVILEEEQRRPAVKSAENGAEPSAAEALWHCAATGDYEKAESLLRAGVDPNACLFASGTPLYQAYGRRDQAMIQLLERYGGKPDATVAGLYRLPALAEGLIAAGGVIGEELLWAAACGGDPEIVRMALPLVDWPRDDARWFAILEQPLRVWNHGGGHWANPAWDRSGYVACLRLILQRCDPNIRGRGEFALTILHSVAGSRPHVTPAERVAFATALLDAGARLDIRDGLLESTPLGWACRWGRIELVRLLLERGADPVEADAQPWATPQAWAKKSGDEDILALLH